MAAQLPFPDEYLQSRMTADYWRQVRAREMEQKLQAAEANYRLMNRYLNDSAPASMPITAPAPVEIVPPFNRKKLLLCGV